MGPYDARKNWLRLKERGLLAPSQNATGVGEWWSRAIGSVSAAVNSKGFVMGGHMGNVNVGNYLFSNYGLRIFTIAGIADSFGNPRVPTTGNVFLQAAREDLEPLVGSDRCRKLLGEKILK